MNGEADIACGTSALPADYLERFSGVGRLLGQNALPRLIAAHVCVVGVGGVGSWVVEALARSGIGALTLVDGDDVCVTNTNRQLPALGDTVGRPKVAVLAERVRMISPSCCVTEVLKFYTRGTSDALLEPGFDFLVDCTDRRFTKAHLVHSCRERGLPMLTSGAAGGRRDPSAIRASDLGLAGNDELLCQVRLKLRRDYGWPPGHRGTARPMGVACVFSSEKPVFPQSDGTCAAEAEQGTSLRMDCGSGFGAATFVTGVFGFVAAAEVVRLLLRDDVAERAQ